MRPKGYSRKIGAAILASTTLFAAGVAAEEPTSPWRPSQNQFGITGNIETPSADMQPDGQVSLTASYFGGYLRNTLSAQLLPGVEAAFRYSILEDFNSPARVQPDLFDRSFDIKVRLLQETERWPAVSVGLQDFLGTGIYSSEYLVATKGFATEEFGSFRITAGVGWGRYADQNAIDNPLSAIDRLAQRDNNFGLGGTVNFGRFFAGPDMGIFGGVEWETPIQDLVAKVEYTGDRYIRENRFNNFDQKIPINVGLQYRPLENIEVGAYYMYGSEIGVRLTITGNPFRPLSDADLEAGVQPVRPRDPVPGNPQIAALGEVYDATSTDPTRADFNDPRLASVMVHRRLGTVRWAEAIVTARAGDRCPTELAAAIDANFGLIDVVTFSKADNKVVCTVTLRPAGQHAVRLTSRVHASYPTDWYDQPEQRDQLVEILAEALAEENLGLIGIEIAPRRVEVYIENNRYRSQPRAIGRTARALTRTMPASVEIFEITPVENSLPVATIVLQRSQLEDQAGRPDAEQRSWATAKVESADPVPWSSLTGTQEDFPAYSWNIAPTTPTSLFDPDNPFRIDVALEASGSIEFYPGFSVNATVIKRLAGNLDEITRGPGSQVEERVRSEIAQYLNEGDPAITRLTVDYVTKLNSQIYGRLSAGLLERMFGGVSGEVLWKPADQDWGLGLELNYVRQRDFDGLFSFQSYDTFTGHASFYWDTNFYNIAMQVDAGRYLAGDWGGTFSMKRRFANGWEFGGFFTLTTIPFDEFGEGSFDKGLFLTIPLNWVLPYETQNQYSTVLRPLTRDGGARLDVSNRLYPIVEDEDVGNYREIWEEFWQ